MTTDQPTTPRAALLAFAAYLDHRDFPAPLLSSDCARLAREHAERLPDEADELLRLSEFDPPLTEDEVRRTHALHAAATFLARHGTSTQPEPVLRAAVKFEEYLRGDQ